MPTEERLKKMENVAAGRDRGVVMVIEDVHDPHNAAAILRSCDAFGVQRVCFIFEKQEAYNPRKVGKKTSASANKWLDFEIYNSTKECLEKLKAEGFEIFGTALEAGAMGIGEADFRVEKVAVMIGNEHSGLSDEALKLVDHTVIIPMKGMVQSLNVSVTAALCLYEVSRQRGGKYTYSEKEMLGLVERWSI